MLTSLSISLRIYWAMTGSTSEFWLKQYRDMAYVWRSGLMPSSLITDISSWMLLKSPWENRLKDKLSHNMNKMSVRPAKTQISLGIHPVWSESSLCTQWVAKDPMFLHADSEDSDQTGQTPRLIWVFAGRTLTLLVLSCRSSFHNNEDFTPAAQVSKICVGRDSIFQIHSWIDAFLTTNHIFYYFSQFSK